MLISIGIPIYNVEKYIEQCARSLFEQTYKDIEYIFINDKTPDNSIYILNSVINDYPQRKKNVKIIEHTSNRGLGAARNTGIENMSGDFIMWVDSDDYLDIYAVEKLVNKQVATSADIITFSHYKIYENRRVLFKISECNSQSELIKLMLVGKGDMNSIWGRLIKKTLYTDYNIKVQEGCNMGEDLQVVPKLFFYAHKIAYIQEPLYYYNCKNSNSYTSNFSKEKGIQSLQATSILIKFFKNNSNSILEYVYKRRIMTIWGLCYSCALHKGNTDFYHYLKVQLSLIDSQHQKIIPVIKRIGLNINNYNLFRFFVKLINTIR